MAADDQPVDLDTDLVRQLARALSGLHRDVRDLSPLPRSAKYGTDSPDNTGILDEYADAIYTQLAQKAWTTYVDSLNSAMSGRVGSLESEVASARGGEASIDARLDGYAALLTSLNAAMAGKASTAQITNLQNQINDGKASVNALRNDLINLRQWLADQLGATPPGSTGNPW